MEFLSLIHGKFFSNEISLLLRWQRPAIISVVFYIVSFARQQKEVPKVEGPKSEILTAKQPEIPSEKGLPASDPTSSTHKKQWNTLTRVSAGPRASQFPQISQMFQGDKASKLQALKLYLEQDENLEQCESAITVQKRYKDSLNHNRRWMTVKQMKEAGCSEWPGGNKRCLCTFHSQNYTYRKCNLGFTK